MVLAYILVGVIAGFVGFLIALATGASFWSAALVYSAVGATSLLLSPLLLLAAGRLGEGRGAETGQAPVPEAAYPQAGPETETGTEIGTGTSLVMAEAASAGLYEMSGPELRILAVDDDPLILGLLPKIAIGAGCPDITLASSGLQAMKAIETSGLHFDCLLLDINMPELDGIELCARIRKLPGYHDTPIIMLTAMNDIDHIERAFRAGATDYTTKPFDVIAMGDRLQTAKAQVAARRAGAESGNAAAAIADQARDQARDPDRRTEVGALIQYDALQNYLARLSGPALSNAYVMAVLVEGPLDNARTFRTVTQAIDDVFNVSGYLMAPTGQGEFLVVANAASLPAVAAMEPLIQDRLNRRWLDTGTAAGHFAAVTLGSAVRPGQRSENRARIAFESAITLAYSRSAAKRGALQSGNVRPLRR